MTDQRPRPKPRSLSRRGLVRAGAVAAATGVPALLAACAMPGGSGAAQDTPKAKAPLTLSVWHWDAYLIEPYKELGTDFARQHPHVTVSVEPTPHAEFAQKLTTAIVGGTAPDVSCIAENNGRIGFSSKGQFTDLGPRVSRE